MLSVLHRRVLVTGSAGVVGRALVEDLREHGYDVVASTSQDGDLRDPDTAERIVKDAAPNAVVHLAARVHGLMGNIHAQGRAYLDNIRINTNIVEAARLAGVSKFVGMGSTAVYSDAVPLPMRESDVWIGPPHGSEAGYAHAKRAMIAQLDAYRQEFDLDFAVALSTNLYGPGDRFDEAHGHVLPSLVSKFQRAVETGTDVTVWGTGTPTRDFVYSYDAARALRMILEEYSGVINLATGTSVTIRQAVETLADVSGFSGQVVWDSTKPDGQHARTYDVSLIRQIGWEPRVDLAAGLDATYRWYAEHRASARR
jgi:GDP-L-fucose synthase